MHNVDPTTESMIRSVLAYAENRLRLDPVPLDQGSRDPAELDAALKGLPGPGPHTPDQVLGVWASAMAPAVISADSPRFLGFIPAAAGRRWRVAVSEDAHSSITNTLRILEMDPLVVRSDDHRLTGAGLRAVLAADGRPDTVAAVVATSGTTNAGIIDDLAGVAEVA